MLRYIHTKNFFMAEKIIILLIFLIFYHANTRTIVWYARNFIDHSYSSEILKQVLFH